jgi:hypothetical protein
MNPTISLPLVDWQNFYVIVGSAAGALTGVQFVVLTLIAQFRASSSMREIRAFGTPTVVHFCSALLVSALMVMPLRSISGLSVCVGMLGTLGVIYSLTIFVHAHKAEYNPDVEDWIWYTALPLAAHFALVVSAVLLWKDVAWSLYVVATATMAFVLLGVHNSWDTVTYVAVKHSAKSTSELREL